MDKKQLLEFIQSLPENLFVEPLEHQERIDEPSGWESQQCFGVFVAVNEQKVKNRLTLHLNFATKYEGEFIRSQQNKDVVFSNECITELTWKN